MQLKEYLGFLKKASDQELRDADLYDNWLMALGVPLEEVITFLVKSDKFSLDRILTHSFRGEEVSFSPRFGFSYTPGIVVLQVLNGLASGITKPRFESDEEPINHFTSISIHPYQKSLFPQRHHSLGNTSDSKAMSYAIIEILENYVLKNHVPTTCQYCRNGQSEVVYHQPTEKTLFLNLPLK